MEAGVRIKRLTAGHTQYWASVLCRTGVVRVFRPGTISWLREALRLDQFRARPSVRGVCEREDSRNTKGRYRTASARKALPALPDQMHFRGTGIHSAGLDAGCVGITLARLEAYRWSPVIRLPNHCVTAAWVPCATQ